MRDSASATDAYAAPAPLNDERGIFADGARRGRSGFLFREIEFTEPFQGRLVYSGWWFVQRITIDRRSVWRKISWLTLEREIRFRLPATVDALQPECHLRIDFGAGLRIRRFQLVVGGRFAYDEIH